MQIDQQQTSFIFIISVPVKNTSLKMEFKNINYLKYYVEKL